MRKKITIISSRYVEKHRLIKKKGKIKKELKEDRIDNKIKNKSHK